ncbi:PfkB family carbohydrate kinase [Nocardioides sp. SYSU D00038]|uniref:PfkB family carbohydrate kinase n=1 Tax=Nocardioides sp. SYSU D00038 TaxID=2812554 RepID=UPI00196835E2|nr:PfkB family carbohydrate kinase [Nocardioides sp. SYSU D00038]
MGRVVVVGGINQDLVVRVSRRPRAGETVVGDGPVRTSGGKGANMAVAAARAGADVVLCAAVGDDDAGREQLAELRAAGVDPAHVAVRPDVATGVALITVTPDGENAIAVGAGANATLTDAEVTAACAGADVVLAQTEVGAGPVEAAARQAGRLVLSPAPVVALSPATLAAADPLVVNEEEATELLADTPVADLADAVRRRTGARSVVVTLGADGAQLADGTGSRHVAAPVVEAVDTTGAGDVLAGTLAAALAAGADLDAAVRAGTAAAAECVGRVGARGTGRG